MFCPFFSFPNLQPHLSMSRPSKAEWIQFLSANIAVLTADDDVDRGDGLREWKFIYVARSSQTALHC